MRAIKPLRPTGLNLGFRLYLLLTALFLPTFFVYSVNSARAIEALHAREVDTSIERAAARLEAWFREYIAVDPTQEERDRLRIELRSMTEEPPGSIDSVSVFWISGNEELKFLEGYGTGVPSDPSREDRIAAALESPSAPPPAPGRGETQSLDIVRGETALKVVSIPLQYYKINRGAIHLVLQIDKVGHGRRVPQLRTALMAGAIGMMLVTGVGVAVFFHFAVGRPMRRLIDAMTRATEGDLNALVDVNTTEIGVLSGAYNQMMRKLRGFNEELKQKVESAVREVAAKNAQLETANERLLALQRQLTALEKLSAQGQIAAVIAHELGTPLNAMSGHLQLLLEDRALEPRVGERLRVVDGQVDRLAGIVREMLQAMRVPPPRCEAVDLRRVVGAVTELFAPVAAKRGVSIDVRWKEGLPAIQADPDQLQQVFVNLFTNAMEAMEGGGTLRVAGAPAEEGKGIRIEVSDTGGGMDDEATRHAFEPFHSRKGSDSVVGAGLGLGLSICREIVRNHHGEISVTTEKGKGTTFTVGLPA